MADRPVDGEVAGGAVPTAFAAVEIDLDELIDLDEFPIHDLSSSRRRAVVSETTAQMDAVGCCRLSGFVRPDAVQRMRDEATSLHSQTSWSRQHHNPYFSPDDPSFPADHPRRTFRHRTTGFINADLLTPDSVMRVLYDSDVLLHFIWECLGTPRPVYRWADPLGRNPYGVTDPGHSFPWHFDGNEFTVSIVAQKADRGGVFEYVPSIRRPDAECYERVADVLAGGRDGVRQLDLQPGDLQVFAGRYSLHRVTEVEGETTRFIGLPTYVHDPYRMNRPYHSEIIYGRATELHYQRAMVLVDGLVD